MKNPYEWKMIDYARDAIRTFLCAIGWHDFNPWADTKISQGVDHYGQPVKDIDGQTRRCKTCNIWKYRGLGD